MLELVAGSSVDQILEANGPFSEELTRESSGVKCDLLTLCAFPLFSGRFMNQLFSALAYCHDKGICHRDIKCRNILLDNEENCKFADFGSAKVVYDLSRRMQPSSSFSYTLSWVAPEVLTGSYNGYGAVRSLASAYIRCGL